MFRIGTEGAELLGSSLAVCQFLECLNLSNNSLRDEGLHAIAPSFGYNTSIKTLILSQNGLTHISGFDLGDALEENMSIEKLDISWNEMFQEPGLKKLFTSTASNNTAIRHLNLSWNGLQGDKTANFIKLFISKHRGITTLDISNNRFEGLSVMTMLAQGVNQSETLYEMHLQFNPINEDDAYALLSTISLESTLRFLNLDGVWTNREFIKLYKQMQLSSGLRVKVGGVFGGKDIQGPNMQVYLLERAHFLGLKPKKKRDKKDFGWFLLRLKAANTLQPVKKSKFEELVDQDKIKFEEGLADEIAKQFRNEDKRIDLPRMLELYLDLFPLTQLPKAKGKKKKDKTSVINIETNEDNINVVDIDVSLVTESAVHNIDLGNDQYEPPNGVDEAKSTKKSGAEENEGDIKNIDFVDVEGSKDMDKSSMLENEENFEKQTIVDENDNRLLKDEGTEFEEEETMINVNM